MKNGVARTPVYLSTIRLPSLAELEADAPGLDRHIVSPDTSTQRPESAKCGRRIGSMRSMRSIPTWFDTRKVWLRQQELAQARLQPVRLLDGPARGTYFKAPRNWKEMKAAIDKIAFISAPRIRGEFRQAGGSVIAEAVDLVTELVADELELVVIDKALYLPAFAWAAIVGDVQTKVILARVKWLCFEGEAARDAVESLVALAASAGELHAWFHDHRTSWSRYVSPSLSCAASTLAATKATRATCWYLEEGKPPKKGGTSCGICNSDDHGTQRCPGNKR